MWKRSHIILLTDLETKKTQQGLRLQNVMSKSHLHNTLTLTKHAQIYLQICDTLTDYCQKVTNGDDDTINTCSMTRVANRRMMSIKWDLLVQKSAARYGYTLSSLKWNKETIKGSYIWLCNFSRHNEGSI